MKRSCMISQPRYMPSMTYLMRIAIADYYIAYDDVQRVPRDIENRNRVINPNGGTQWLSVSICSSSRELIKHSKLCSFDDYRKHRQTIKHFYKDYPYYEQYIVDGYFDALEISLQMRDSFVNGLVYLFNLLELKTEIMFSSWHEYKECGGALQLIEICKSVNCDTYVGGMGGRHYGMNEELCTQHGIKLIEDTNVIEPQVGFFHHLFLQGLDHWIKEADKINKMYI